MAKLQGPCVSDVNFHFVQRWNHAHNCKEEFGLWPTEESSNDMPYPTEVVSVTKGKSKAQIQRTLRKMKANLPKSSLIANVSSFDSTDGEASIFYQVTYWIHF
jgi:hypothetical protein